MFRLHVCLCCGYSHGMTTTQTYRSHSIGLADGELSRTELVDSLTLELVAEPRHQQPAAVPAIGARVRIDVAGYASVFGTVATAPYLGVAHRRELFGTLTCVRVTTDCGSYFAHAVADLSVIG